VLLVLALAPVAMAATVPTGFAETTVTNQLLPRPTAMAFAPDGRLFVTDQDGRVAVIKNGTLLSTPFLSLNVDGRGERGLLGIAFDPQFTTNRWVYVYYTTPASPHNRISRVTASGDVAVTGSEQVIFELPPLTAAQNHNGGAIHFGPDGKLYVGVGDNATSSNSQTLSTTKGKMLRINKDGTIPTDNPFYATATGQNRAIWALGLRNPFTFAWQPGPGRMFINDVGQGAFEEIDDGIAGSNYGWPDTEGPTNDPRFRTPLFAYAHGNTATTGCAITGGTFYNPSTSQFPASYVGDYFFADFCNGWIRKRDSVDGTATTFASSVRSAIDIDIAADGSLYYLARLGGTGQVYRVSYTGSQAPTITTHPASQTVSTGQSATFTVTASGGTPMSYQWQRNGIDIIAATSSSYTISNVQASDNGARFRVRVTNNWGTALSNDAVLTVTSNQPPAATIDTPVSGTLYSGGQTISYSGRGTDPEDGTLPGSRFTWRIDFHHADHVHPFTPSSSGSTGGSFTVPTTGHTEANVWYRIHLTVTDSGGRTASTFRDVQPRVVQVALATNPAGLQLRLDGQPVTAPHSFAGVVGIQRALEAVSPQTVNSTTWNFQSWSNGGARAQTISTPSTNTTYTATYASAQSAFQAKVNFQPASAPTVAGYLVDGGLAYGSRGNGYTYGWNAVTPVLDRNARNAPDQRYDTFAQMQHHTNSNASWEIAVPNGTYQVHVVAGDPASSYGVYRIAVEGALTVDGTPTSEARWVEGTATVTVSDGRLTISNYAGASSNKLCFVEIASA
jgi:glucose/arabinose dehydrogenase